MKSTTNEMTIAREFDTLIRSAGTIRKGVLQCPGAVTLVVQSATMTIRGIWSYGGEPDLFQDPIILRSRTGIDVRVDLSNVVAVRWDGGRINVFVNAEGDR